MVDESGVMSKKEIQGRVNTSGAVNNSLNKNSQVPSNSKLVEGDKTSQNKNNNSSNVNSNKNNNLQKQTSRNINAPVSKVEYRNMDHFDLAKWLDENIPKAVIPTTKTAYALGGIIVLILLLALVKFPYGKMMNPNPNNLDLNISIGEPWVFFEIQLYDPMANPLRVGALIGSFFLYLFIAYLIDILINTIIGTPLIESEEEKKKHPKFYKNKRIEEGRDPSEMLTRKMFSSKERFDSSPSQNNKGVEQVKNKTSNVNNSPEYNKGLTNNNPQPNNSSLTNLNNNSTIKK